MKFQNLILVSLPFFCLSCSGPEDIGLNINGKGNTEHVYYTEGENPTKTEFIGTISQNCPVGVICDTSFGYLDYSGTIDSLKIYLSFKSQWLNNRTYQGVVDNFNYLYFSLHLPSRENDSVFYYYNQNAVWGHKFDSSSVYSCITGYNNDTLSGIIKVKFQYLNKVMHSRDSNCRTGDIAGICTEMLDEPAEYIIQYKIKLE